MTVPSTTDRNQEMFSAWQRATIFSVNRPATWRLVGGAGLGLSIARWIVDLHGGYIHAEHRQPNGCRIVVTLPGGST